MKRNKRKMRKEFKKLIWCFLFMVFCGLLSAYSSIYFITKRNALTIEIQIMEREIDELKNENSKLEYEIASLENKDRVLMIAKEADMSQNTENIISIK